MFLINDGNSNRINSFGSTVYVEVYHAVYCEVTKQMKRIRLAMQLITILTGKHSPIWHCDSWAEIGFVEPIALNSIVTMDLLNLIS